MLLFVVIIIEVLLFLLTQKYTSLLETNFSYFSFHAGVYEVPNFLLNCWTNINYELQRMFLNDYWCIKYNHFDHLVTL